MENHIPRLGGPIRAAKCNANTPRGLVFHRSEHPETFMPDIRALVEQMIEQARGKFSKSRNVAMHLSFWTDGR